MSDFTLKQCADYINEKNYVKDISLQNYITTDNILQNKQGIQTALSLPAQEGKLNAFKKGDILLANIRPYLKKIWYADFNGGCSADVLAIRAKENIDSCFLFYALFRDDFFVHAMKGVKGTKMPRGDKSQIMEFKIPKFNLPTQKSIANILSTLDQKITINNQINAQLEQMAKTLYDYWFVQFDFPDENGKPYKSSGGEMVYNETLKREIPKGWEVGKIKDYCISTGGFAFKSTEWTSYGNPVIKIKNIKEDQTLDIIDMDYIDLSNRKIDEKFKGTSGNIVIAMTGATIGKFAIIPKSDVDLYINQRVGYFNLGNNPINRLPFLINSLNMDYFREAIFSLSNGAAQPNISNEQINNINLLLPHEILIQEFNQKLKSNYSLILNNQYENQQLTQLRDFLLPMLMNGQVGVGDG